MPTQVRILDLPRLPPAPVRRTRAVVVCPPVGRPDVSTQDAHSSTGTTSHETFVGRAGGDESGGVGRSGAEARGDGDLDHQGAGGPGGRGSHPPGTPPPRVTKALTQSGGSDRRQVLLRCAEAMSDDLVEA